MVFLSEVPLLAWGRANHGTRSSILIRTLTPPELMFSFLNHLRSQARFPRLHWYCTGVLILGLGGCQPSGPSSQEPARQPVTTTEAPAAPESEPTTTSPVVATPTTEKPAAATEPVSVRVGGGEEYAEMLSELKGKVVLVDFWATWCVPCVKQLPHTIELARKHADQGLRVFTVNFDDPETDQAKVQTFLEKRQAGLPTLISKYGVGTESTTAFEMVAGGALPGYKLYDRAGKLRYTFCDTPAEGDQAEIPEMIDQRIAELLAEANP
jgi:thiol-disulfide isomerase/thioredoxin